MVAKLFNELKEVVREFMVYIIIGSVVLLIFTFFAGEQKGQRESIGRPTLLMAQLIKRGHRYRITPFELNEEFYVAADDMTVVYLTPMIFLIDKDQFQWMKKYQKYLIAFPYGRNELIPLIPDDDKVISLPLKILQ